MSAPIIQLQSAFEHFNDYRSTLKMTTGSPELDSIIDSIQQGQFYLFYGTNKAILDGLVCSLLYSILPNEHGFESMALYINNTDSRGNHTTSSDHSIVFEHFNDTHGPYYYAYWKRIEG